MRVRVLFFAGLREAVGLGESSADLPDDCCLEEALKRLRERWPAVDAYGDRLLVSVNTEHAPLDAPLRDGDEIAFLPPMSGGSDAESERVWVQPSPLSLDVLLREVSGPGFGGIVTFTGVVRDHAKGQAIEHLEYEAYAPMAEKEMRKIVTAAGERWPGVRVAMSHRIGRLEIGDAAVMIAAAGAHRPEAFEACRFAIDTLKQTVPIWKKEFGEDGTYWVEENP